MLTAEPSLAERDLPRWNASSSAAPRSPTPPPWPGARRFGDVLHQVFGQTEAVPLTVMTPQEWFSEVPGSEPLRAAGKVLPFARLEVRDEDGHGRCRWAPRASCEHASRRR